MRILVIGATGTLGAPVVQHLHAAGHTVRIFSRNLEKACDRFGPAYEYAAGDVDHPASLEAALQGCQGVHLSLDGKLDPDLERRGGENVAQAAAKARLDMITYLSGASVIQENCWYPGTKAKFQAEAAIRASGVPYAIFKDTFLMETLPRLVQGKRAMVFGRQPNPWHWLAAEDFARMVTNAYRFSGLEKTFFILGPQALTMNAALQKYCDILHPKTKVVNLPFWVVGLIAAHPSRTELRAALPFFKYAEKVTEAGSPEEANALLGAPTITLEQWATARKN